MHTILNYVIEVKIWQIVIILLWLQFADFIHRLIKQKPLIDSLAAFAARLTIIPLQIILGWIIWMTFFN